ncbi:DgyrCDS1434 [Dimorphilus gyrociliatus]|uniref:DgyrCDS1434 n=1 Tax=Dimorphilus gyrociliatus TaxID=2664684 RepID=A0A7I8V7H8_9ANNE|nr:DgyrCDS1434 [Dimorphilus gyrociliatus]
MWMKGLWQQFWLLIIVICFSIFLVAVSENCEENQFRCDNGQCIHGFAKCDQEVDCQDGSDERNCTIRNCANTTEFQCEDKRNCIPKHWKCDGSEDCTDGSDERNCALCAPGRFLCHKSNGQCITGGWKCDGEKDCPNGEDESDETCSKKRECPKDHFLCPGTSKCIPNVWLCDTDFDCPNQEDERLNCSPKPCSDGEFSCKNDPNEPQECVAKSWKCDGFKDCENGFDEANCNTSVSNFCNETQFACDNSLCIPKSKVCDGYIDCAHKEDEASCSEITCGKDEFFCSSSKLCIPDSLRCNGHPDCLNLTNGVAVDEYNCSSSQLNRFKKCELIGKIDCSDKDIDDPNYEKRCVDWDDFCSKKEKCGASNEEINRVCNIKEECDKTVGSCQGCFPTETSKREACYCPIGYELAADRNSCQAKTKCFNWGVCSHPKKCRMLEGYPKCYCDEGYHLRNRTCRAITPGFIMYAHSHIVKAFSTNANHHSQQPKTIVNQSRHALALAVDINQNRVFYSDMNMGSIWRVDLKEDDLSPRSRTQIQVEKLKLVEGLAYDWVSENLYWTDNGRKVIEVMEANNPTNRRELFTENLMEPRGLAIDPRNGWMYWSDWGKEARIEKAGMDGTKRQTLLAKQNGILWPNGLAIDYYTDTLFWVDGSLSTINRVSLDGTKRSIVFGDANYLRLPYSLAVFEDYIYLSDWSTHGLFKIDKYADIRKNFSVEKLVISRFAVNSVQVFHKKQQPDVADNPCSDNRGGCSHLCLISPRVHSTAPLERTCACPSTGKFTFDGKTKCVSNVKPENTEGGSSSSPDNVDRPVKRQVSADSKAVGRVAGIVIACLVLILILSGIAGYFVHRSYRKRFIRSMNFDNPVYRKTTTSEANEDVLLKLSSNDGSHIPNGINRPTAINHVQMTTEHLMTGELSNHSLA